MKLQTTTTLLLLLPFQILIAQIDWENTHYSGIPDVNKKVIFFDDFSDTEIQWKKSNFEKTTVNIKNNKCNLTANKEDQIIWQDLIMDKDGYEVEVRFKSEKNKKGEPLTLVLAGSKNEFFTFEIRPEGNYAANIVKGDIKISLLEKNTTVHIKKDNFNKIMVRAVDQLLYFFINENLVATHPLPSLNGYRFGVLVSPKNPVIVDYFIMCDLIKSGRKADIMDISPNIIPTREDKSRYKM
jgi:hypothetical protein